MSRTRHLFGKAVLGATLAIALAVPIAANARKANVLYNFTGGASGAGPYWLLEDAAGNFYGGAGSGGDLTCHAPDGCGLIYKLAPGGALSVLFNFQAGASGYGSEWNLVQDTQGDLIGVAFSGPDSNLIFEVDQSGRETVLHSFSGGVDGNVAGPIIRDAATGLIYGMTDDGGDITSPNCAPHGGCGYVYKLDPTTQALTVLYAFHGGDDGGFPGISYLTQDKHGNLYGTTRYAGANDGGVVFKLAPDGTETVLYALGADDSDARQPAGHLAIDSAGNLYGTSFNGGQNHYGAIFKVQPDGTETVLHAFTHGADGAFSYSGAILDQKRGNFYGTTLFGGDPNCNCGVVWEVMADGTFSVVHTWTKPLRNPPLRGIRDLLLSPDGFLHGASSIGGTGACPNGCGAIFAIKK